MVRPLRTVLVWCLLLITCSTVSAETLHLMSESAPSQRERFNGTVELYVTSWCGYCKKALSYVKSQNINYVAYDIENDSAALKRYRELGGHGVPLIIIGKHKMSGYSQETLEYYLNNSGI